MTKSKPSDSSPLASATEVALPPRRIPKAFNFFTSTAGSAPRWTVKTRGRISSTAAICSSSFGAYGAVAGYYAECGLPPPEPVSAPYAPKLEEQIAAVEEIRPRVFTVHLGALPAVEVKKLKALGILLGASATSVAEAQGLESLGFDFVIAQGGEAGGHRGSYLRDPYQALTGTLALTRMIARAVKIPVVAAGGIMDGAGIAAVLALGA